MQSSWLFSDLQTVASSIALKYVNDRYNRANYQSNWENWFTKNNIGMKVSHARMLRTVAKSSIGTRI